MNRTLFSVLAMFLFAASSWAQVSPDPATVADTTWQTPTDNQLAAGTIISVELSKSVDARKSKANDRVEAKTVVDLLSLGQIVIPGNTKIIGHVTEAKAHSKASPDSMVGIAFDRVLLKDGRELPLQAAVQAIGRPLQNASPRAVDDPMTATPAGLPSASQGQRGTMPGAPTTAPSSSYPTGNVARSPSDGAAPVGSTVSPLGPTCQGVIGMEGLSLNASGQVSVVSSNTDNVHLDRGTQLILRVQ